MELTAPRLHAVPARVREHARALGLRALFGDGAYERRTLEYAQPLDRGTLRARLLSSSYTPAAGDPRRAPMLEELDALFAAHQRGGTVAIEYDTEVFWGRRAVLL